MQEKRLFNKKSKKMILLIHHQLIMNTQKWVDNQGDEVKNVFGFNSSAELVNGRAAMIGVF